MAEKLLEGKKGIVFGVANRRSIAWAIASRLSEAGARLAFAYQGERLRDRVEELVATLPEPSPLYSCDVTRDEEIQAVGAALARDFTSIDFLIHCIAFADKADLERDFIETSRSGYLLAQEISSFSLTACSRMAAPLMRSGGSIITLSYLGSVRAVPRYNVMGVAKAALESSVRYLAVDLGKGAIRVNAISAGPINTLAARGISGFADILRIVEEKAPLGRNVEVEEVAAAALFLASPLSSAITGQVLYVDCGFNILGL
ncbi:MAG: enoyl-ACP reductase [Planctomycetes bacterium]|nr:enoyl-ACP reductase [Planctomycetota bacterium]